MNVNEIATFHRSQPGAMTVFFFNEARGLNFNFYSFLAYTLKHQNIVALKPMMSIKKIPDNKLALDYSY